MSLKVVCAGYLQTSKTQVMDQGIIRSSKAHYRAKLVRKQIANIEMKRELPNPT